MGQIKNIKLHIVTDIKYKSHKRMVTTRTVVAGLALAAGVGYCWYFDRKRRSDPLFKQKLKARREAAAQEAKKAKASKIKMPDMSDPQQVQAFLFEQISLGEQCIGAGDNEQAVEHLAVAVLISGQPQILQVFQQQLEPQVYEMLIQKVRQMQAGSMGMGVVALGQALVVEHLSRKLMMMDSTD